MTLSHPRSHYAWLAVYAVVSLALVGCSEKGPSAELGDLDVLQQLGRLRILIPRLDVDHLPREVDLLDRQRNLAESLSQSLGLEPEWIVVSARNALIDYLVEGVGHERASAIAEVRRSFNGSYSPLYQAAYMIGGLQIRALHSELVEGGRMTEREFHDAILQGGPMPIEMVRARLRGEPPGRDFTATWRFDGPN